MPPILRMDSHFLCSYYYYWLILFTSYFYEMFHRKKTKFYQKVEWMCVELRWTFSSYSPLWLKGTELISELSFKGSGDLDFPFPCALSPFETQDSSMALERPGVQQVPRKTLSPLAESQDPALSSANPLVAVADPVQIDWKWLIFKGQVAYLACLWKKTPFFLWRCIPLP